MTIILAADDPGRTGTAMALAAAQGAIGGAAHIHFDAGAIPLLRDAGVVAALATAQSLGATVSLCPTGLADAVDLPPTLPVADRLGLVALMAELDDAARLIVL